MRGKVGTTELPCASLSLPNSICVRIILFLVVIASIGHAHAAAPITSSGLNTQVSQPVTLPTGQTQYNITGGTRPGGGTNLFQSFGDLNVPNNNIANFLNDAGLATSNILGRVTAETSRTSLAPFKPQASGTRICS
jgi:hypothetical protein